MRQLKGNAQRAARAAHSSPEWYTPSWLLERITAFLGEYQDPCPARFDKTIVENGLAMRWTGKVYVNPPYGRDIPPWIRKAVTEPVSELLILVPAYTDTSWFAPLFEYHMCFIRGRVEFTRPGEKAKARAPHPSVLIYRGPRAGAFFTAFSDIGAVMMPMAQTMPVGLWAS